jgi:hypothetical protein
MGLMGFQSPIVVDSCFLNNNGAGQGGQHEIYIGNGGAATLGTASFINCTSTSGELATHALKSRQGQTTVAGGTYTQHSDDGNNAISGSVLDFPDGGAVSITGTHIVMTAGNGENANNWFIGYAMEAGANLGVTGNTLTLKNVRLTSTAGIRGIIGAGKPGCHLVIQSGCVYDGAIPPSLVGNVAWASITGSFSRSG